MNIDERLRDSMSAYVRDIEAPPMRELSPKRELSPRRSKLSGAFAGVVTVVLLVAVVALAVSQTGSDGPRQSPATPRQIAIVDAGGAVWLLDARTGAPIRKLAAGANTEPAVVAAPRGGPVYFLGDPVPGAACGAGQVTDAPVMRVAIGGGPARPVGRETAQSFAVSPDGRRLAIASGEGCAPATTITVLDLSSGDVVHREPSADLPAGVSGGVSDLAWGPDNRHLMFVWEIGSTYPWILDTRTATSLADARKVAIGDGSNIAGYLGTTGKLLGLRFTQAGAREVWSFDVSTASPDRRLFCCGEPVASDRSGDDILVRATTGSGELVWWSTRTKRLTHVAGGYVPAAVWVPGGRR